MSYSNQQKGKSVPFYPQQPHHQRIRYSQLQRLDDNRHPRYIPQQAQRPQHPVPSQSPRIPSPSVSPVAVNTLTHDMNKQGAPSRPAMAASPQQGILPNQPNPGAPPMMNMGQVRFQAPRQTLPRGYQQQMQQQVYPVRHQNQAQMQGIQHPQAGGPATQQGANTGQIMQPSAAAAAASGQFMQQGGAQYIMTGAVPIVPSQMAHRPFHQQSYPQVYQPPTPPYYSSPPQQVWLNTGQSAPRQTFNSQQPATRSDTQQRSKKIIRIVDPTTNQDVTETIMRDTSGSSSPHSGRSSANVTPPVSTSSEDAKRIQAQFASKVAMVASGLPQTDLPQPHRVPPVQQPAPQQPHTQQQPPQQQPPVPQPIPQQLAMQQTQPGQQVIVMPVGPGGQPVVPAAGNFPVIAPGAAPVVAQLPSQPVEPAVSEGTQNTVVAATPVAEAVQPPKPVPQAAAAVMAAAPGQNPVPMQQSGVQEPPTQQVPTEAMPPAVQPPQNPAPVPIAAVPPAGPPANVQAAAAAPVQEAAPAKDELASANTASTATKASPPEQQDATDGAAVPPVVQPTVEPSAKQLEDGSKQTISSANNPAVQQATPVPAVPQPESQDDVAALQESKDSKKKSQKKRLQELDKKTAKGSDEFDAYKTDDVQEPTSSQANPGKEGNVVLEPEAKVSKEPAKEIVQDVSPSEKPTETTQPQEDKRSTEKTDDAPQSDVAKRKNEKELMMSEKQAEVAVVPDTTPAKLDAEEKPDHYDTTEDRENVNEADNVESENSKNKEGKPNPKDNKMQLKYTYREGQWSPVNPEGKKEYGRDFLLQFQKECTDKPDGLPNIPDIVLDKAVVQPLSLNINQGGNQKSSDFMPHFMKSPRVQGKQPNYPAGQGRRSSREPLKVIQRARDSAETKLATSDKAWKPGYKRGPEESQDEEAVKTAELYRNFTSILNKLTPQLFTKLTDKALKLPIDTEERLTGVIQLVFEKAISEPNFSTAYAHMCQKLSQLKVQSSTTPGQQVQFRPILVHNCQQEFEKEKQSELDEAQRRKEISQLPANQQEAQLELLDEKLFKAKRRTMGNIRFIGELYKLRILTENIMHNCVMKLLKAKDDDALECLCNLMSTIGRDLDHEKAKNRMDQYFSKIDKIIASQKNQPRIRFLMCDLVDLRKNNWVPRRQESKPTTIDALHREWHVAEAKKAEEAKNYNGPSRSREQAPPPRTVTPQADDGWNTVPTTNKTRTAYDPAKLKLTRMTTADDNIQLGPGGRGFNMWGRGSIGASNKSQSTSDSASSQEDSAPTQANRFSMLSEDAKRPVSRGGSGGYSSRDSRGRGQSPISKRSSRERDRDREKEAAIAEVQRISRGRPSRPEQPEPRGSKEIAPRPEKKEEPTMTDAKVKQTSKATIDEFLNLRDFAEASRCVSELPSKQRHLFVQATVDHIIEKKQDMREAVGVFFHSLMNSNLLTKEQYLTGMKDMIEFAEDMAIDIPKIYEYLGELMGAMLVGGADYLQLHATTIKPLIEHEKAGVLLAEILRTASRRIGASKVCHIWQQASLKWENFLPAGENVQEFVQKKGVDFTLDGASAADNGLNSVSSQGDWLHVFNRGLTNLLNDRPDNNKIFDWIEHNVADTQKQHSEFIRALVTIICQNAAEGEGQSCRIDPEILKQRGPVLQRYIDNKRPLELQALYAVQALNHSLHSPPGLLRILFDVLYDEDVVTEEAFYDWKASEDPKESAGKGVALKSVTSFFTWLAEAEVDA